jgi:EAL domain-containing protein (putative c-di-GMP-specific phosphodiesterase class I)
MRARDVIDGGLRCVYQPVVDLESGTVLGYEALARGPEGTELESPYALLAAARAEGTIVELDWACRAEAIRGALDADLGSSLTLFVNVEPDTNPTTPPAAVEPLLAEARRRLRIVVEVTEGAIVDSPADLLATVEWSRQQSWGVALDDLGSDSGSLAVMPFLVPDVIKLDLTLVQQHGRSEVGRIVSAVLAQAEHTGAAVLAEGIETEEHRETALAMGATLGQGWLFGRPGPLPPDDERPAVRDAVTLLRSSSAPPDATPFAVVRGARPLRRGDKQLLRGIASHLEEQAMVWRETPVVLSCFEAGERVDAASLARYSELAAGGAFVAVLGPDVEAADGVRVGRFPRESPLADEWSVLLVGAHYNGGLVARRVDGDCYDFAVTHDRDLVVEAGRALMRHVALDASPP